MAANPFDDHHRGLDNIPDVLNPRHFGRDADDVPSLPPPPAVRADATESTDPGTPAAKRRLEAASRDHHCGITRADLWLVAVFLLACDVVLHVVLRL